MRKLIWGKTFIRTYRRTLKNHPNLRKDIEETLRLLTETPFAPKLETHKLKGKLSGSWACSAGYDMRIIFDFIKEQNKHEDSILLLGIGTHDDVY